MSDAGARLVAGEFARCESETRDRPAERVVVDALEIEARLDWHAAQRGANGLAFHPQRIGRQTGVAHRARTLELDGADDRAIGMDTALAARAFKAVAGKH